MKHETPHNPNLNLLSSPDIRTRSSGNRQASRQRKHRAGFATVAVLAVAGLVAAACSSGSDSTAPPPAAPVAVASTEPAPAPTTSGPQDGGVVLPDQVPDVVAENPSFPQPVPTTTPPPTTTANPNILVPGTTAPPVTIPAQTGVSGFEFTTPGANGNVFYVQLGATHPLAVCFSYTDGNPRLSSLQAGTIDAATAEIADIGNQCVQAVSGEEFEVDVSDVAVGCVDAAGTVSNVCADVGIPDFPTTTTETPDNPTQTPPATTIPPTTTTVPPQPVSDKPSLAGLTPQEILTTRLELFQTYPLPVEGAGIGGFPTDEDFRTWERVVYSQLNNIAYVGDLSPEVNGVFVRTTDQPEFLTLLEQYEGFMRLAGYTFYNTCASERFPQITPGSSMLDFIHRENEPLTSPPAGREESWYADQAAQATHDFRNAHRILGIVEQPQMLLCQPLFGATEAIIPGFANSLWQPDDNRNFISPRPAEGFRHYTVALSSDRQIAITVSCYLADDRDEYRDAIYVLNTMIWEDSIYKLNGQLINNAEGNEYQSCEEAVTDGGNLEMFLTENLHNWGPQYVGKTYDIFPPDKYQYEGVNLLDLT